MKLDFDVRENYLVVSGLKADVAILYSEKAPIALLDYGKLILFQVETNGKVSFRKHSDRFKRENAWFLNHNKVEERKTNNVDLHELIEKI